MNCLLLYNQTQTYTNTVYEYLAAFSRYSSHRFFFAHHDHLQTLNVDTRCFDAVGIHYSVRLPFDQIADSATRLFQSFGGVKFLFIQDEYDYTHRAWYWIKTLDIGLVFTVVPEENIHRVYPREEFPHTRFVSVLTGYVPEHLPIPPDLRQPSQREIVIGYRGRNLPLQYGSLGQEKARIGQMVHAWASSHGIRTDIAWTESERIYGDAWYKFIASCRATLGSESGSNAIDWDGTLSSRIKTYRESNPDLDDMQILEKVVTPLEQPGLMNQISPRIFEAAATHTALVLFEGRYSGILQPGRHYIPLKRDGSNLAEVFEELQDAAHVDRIAQNAYTDLIASGNYGYARFVERVDALLVGARDHASARIPGESSTSSDSTDLTPTPITTVPIRAKPPEPSILTEWNGWRNAIRELLSGRFDWRKQIRPLLIVLWLKLPKPLRDALTPPIKRLFLGS